jgi:hypothetical protein
MAHQQQTPVPPAARNPDVPRAFSEVILRALAKEPEARFASAGAFRDALQGALGRRWAGGSAASIQPPPGAPAVPPPGASAGRTLLFAPAMEEALAPTVSTPRPALRTPDAPPTAPAPRAAAAPSSPTPPPPASPLQRRFLVRLTLPGQTTRSLPCLQLTRGGGLLLADEAAALPARTRLAAVLELPRGEAPCTLEVVGHVDLAQARAWGTAAGHWVQLVEARSEVRAQLEELARGVPPPSPATVRVADDPWVDRQLAPLRAGAGADPYGLLGLAPDAPFDRVRARVRELQQVLTSIQGRQLSPRQRGEVESAAERLQRATALVSTPAARARHDAERGNWAGVARCIAAGLMATELGVARTAYLARHPGAETRSRIHQVTAASWEARGEMSQALLEYERALAADPLHLELHQRYWPLRQRGAPARRPS